MTVFSIPPKATAAFSPWATTSRRAHFQAPDSYPLEFVEVAYYNEAERRAGVAYLASRT